MGCDSDSDDGEEDLVEVRGEEEDLSDTDPEDEWNTPQSVQQGMVLVATCCGTVQ